MLYSISSHMAHPLEMKMLVVEWQSVLCMESRPVIPSMGLPTSKDVEPLARLLIKGQRLIFTNMVLLRNSLLV